MIETERNDGIGYLRINRPAARNALTPDLQDALREGFRALADDAEVGAIIIAGVGEAFCAGGDVKAMQQPQTRTAEEQVADLRRREEIVAMIRGAGQVVIAEIRGPATGAGLALALACDLRLCDPSARFGAVYARVGLTGDFGIAWLLQSEIGASHARALLLGAEIVGAERALEIGLVHEIVAPEGLAERALARARSFADGPRAAYAAIKHNLAAAPELGLAGTLDLEARALVAAKATPDHREAIAAFVEKRAPRFGGR